MCLMSLMSDSKSVTTYGDQPLVDISPAEEINEHLISNNGREVNTKLISTNIGLPNTVNGQRMIPIENLINSRSVVNVDRSLIKYNYSCTISEFGNKTEPKLENLGFVDYDEKYLYLDTFDSIEDENLKKVIIDISSRAAAQCDRFRLTSNKLNNINKASQLKFEFVKFDTDNTFILKTRPTSVVNMIVYKIYIDLNSQELLFEY